MVANGKKDLLKSVRERRYLNKDFPAFRSDLLSYARTYYGNKIKDFSEASMGGVLLDFAAYVGDTMSFYMDHQFSELDHDTAVEDANVERLLRNAGVKIVGASPAVVDATFFIEVPAIITSTGFAPNPVCLPVILKNTALLADNGTKFKLIDDLDFSKVDSTGRYLANVSIATIDANNQPLSFVLQRAGMCVSGDVSVESYTVGSFERFRKIQLRKPHVTDIISVRDSDQNEYHIVESLSHDTVFKIIPNANADSDIVDDVLELIPAPYRFTAEASLANRYTTLTFGGGDAATLEDDIVPDPSEFAIPLYGKKTFTRFTLDPNRLLNTTTLGVAKSDTTLTITYRHGGGLQHNVESNTVNTIDTLYMKFPSGVTSALAAAVRSSIDVLNTDRSIGGEDAPSIDDLRSLIPASRNSQARVVTKSDLLARIYTMPSNLGRVFRAATRSAPNNPLTSELFIINRNGKGQLVHSPDSLKKNIRVYLNSFRLSNDAIDILDAGIVNIGLSFEIVVDNDANRSIVLAQVFTKLKKYFDIKNFQIDQPIVIGDVRNMIYNTPSVVSVNDIQFTNVVGKHGDKMYSDVLFDIKSNTKKDMIVPPPGHIFEIKFPDDNIKGALI